jgi:hypothetical protein
MKWLAFLLSLVLAKLTFAQSNFNLQASLGTISKIYPQFPKSENNSYTLSIQYNKQLTGTKSWHQNYKYPTKGIGVYFLQTGSNVLGINVAVSPQLGFKQKLTHQLSLFENVGLGLSYANNPFDELTNPKNIAIGSTLSAFAVAQIGIEYDLKRRYSLNLFTGVMHYSNAHVQLPNVGLNVFNVGMGIKYKIKPHQHVKLDTLQQFDNRWHLNVKLAMGINEQGSSIIAVNGPKYPIYIASVFVARKLSYINKLHIGVELMRNMGFYDFMVSQKLYTSAQKQKSYTAHVFTGHEFLMGHLSVYTMAGFYFYNPFYKAQHDLYFKDDFKSGLKKYITLKLGLHYYIFNTHKKTSNQWYLGSYVKTNFGQADYWENAIGFQF